MRWLRACSGLAAAWKTRAFCSAEQRSSEECLGKPLLGETRPRRNVQPPQCWVSSVQVCQERYPLVRCFHWRCRDSDGVLPSPGTAFDYTLSCHAEMTAAEYATGVRGVSFRASQASTDGSKGDHRRAHPPRPASTTRGGTKETSFASRRRSSLDSTDCSGSLGGAAGRALQGS